MSAGRTFSDDDFRTLETLLEQDEPTRDLTLRAITPASRRAMFREMLELDSDQGTAIDGSVSTAFPDLLRPDGLIHEGLELVREIGRGGMGVVYEAFDTSSGRAVAVKVLSVPLAISADAEVRFRREADLLRRLDHPNIVAVQRTGSIEGLPYIVFDLVEGQTLQERLAAMTTAGGVGEAWWWRAAEWVRVLAGALEHAHQHEVVHRDVKPANILLGEGDVPLLTDFGIARVVDATTITQGNESPGSPSYMSPEQLGVVDADVGPCTDVYGLGLVLFECLTLTRARRSTSKPDVARECLHRPAGDPRRVSSLIPRSLAAICVRSLATDPRERYPSAAALAEALDLASRGLLRPTRHPWRAVQRALSRRRTTVAVVVTLVLCAFAGAVVLMPRTPMGRLAISAPPGARLTLRHIDPVTHMPGPARPIGSARSLGLSPGTYRVEMATPAGMREYTREVADRRTASVTVWPDAGQQVRAADMVLVSGGVATIGHPTPPVPELGVRVAMVPPFWIDKREVSNAEYRAFVLATGRPAPAMWPTPYPVTWDDLPVTGVSVEDARAYAEWVGKRLPTDVEWEVAAAGLNAIPFPWSGEAWAGPEVVIDIAAEAQAWTGELTDAAVRRAYLEHVRAVTNAGPDISPTGIMNAWGNVAEWTESTITIRAEGMPIPISCNLAKGRNWADRNPHAAFLQSVNLAPVGTVSPGVGFRCAASAEPNP